MLCLDITWLTGTAVLARDPSDPAPDWPPEPDRIFSALVASWGLGGEDPAERAALEWLEAQEPPQLYLPEPPCPRKTVTVYVPANDVSGPNPKQKDPQWLSKIKKGETLREFESREFWRALGTVILGQRVKNDRTFPAVALDPEAPLHLSLVWNTAVPEEHGPALEALAQRTSYIGHSSSLVRVQFRTAVGPPGKLELAKRAPYRGRLAELEALHKRHMDGDELARPRPATRQGVPPPAPTASRPFAADAAQWFVFEHAGGERPDLRAQAGLSEAMRQALMEAWTRANGEPAPSWVSGHEADGAPTRDPHLAILPMANVGWEHSDGRLMGLALVPPAREAAAWAQPGPEGFRRRQAFRRALERLGESDADGRIIVTLAPRGGGTWQWRLTPAVSGLRSLDPARYLREAPVWATATPVLLDRHLKSAAPPERDPEAEAIICAACAREGLPMPISVGLSKHAAVTGAPSARPAGGNPRWMNWARRPSFGQRALVHVRLVFNEPIPGPILLGAARFYGLGLFLPIRGGGQ